VRKNPLGDLLMKLIVPKQKPSPETQHRHGTALVAKPGKKLVVW
jgi:hypothetical protein